jgi:hypothetical protein
MLNTSIKILQECKEFVKMILRWKSKEKSNIYYSFPYMQNGPSLIQQFWYVSFTILQITLENYVIFV